MGLSVVHFEVGGKNPSKLKQFYGKLFEWNITDHPGTEYGLVEAQNKTGIGGGIGATPEGVEPYVTFYVHCEDLDSHLKRAQDLGGKVVMPVTPIPEVGTMAWIADPEGNRIGLFKPGE